MAPRQTEPLHGATSGKNTNLDSGKTAAGSGGN
jgi:hypothetical protein